MFFTTEERRAQSARRRGVFECFRKLGLARERACLEKAGSFLDFVVCCDGVANLGSGSRDFAKFWN